MLAGSAAAVALSLTAAPASAAGAGGIVLVGSSFLGTYPCNGGLPTLTSSSLTAFPCSTTFNPIVDEGAAVTTGGVATGSASLSNITYSEPCLGLPLPTPAVGAASGNYSAPGGFNGVFQWGRVGLTAVIVTYDAGSGLPTGAGAAAFAPTGLGGNCTAPGSLNVDVASVTVDS
jgi:hypothetical protein